MPKVKKEPRVEKDLLPISDQHANIILNFDFDKVLEYMNWDKSYRGYDDNGKCIYKGQWKILTKEGFKVPTSQELRTLANRLLNDVIKCYTTKKSALIYMASGPFIAICRYGELELIANITSWSGDR